MEINKFKFFHYRQIALLSLVGSFLFFWNTKIEAAVPAMIQFFPEFGPSIDEQSNLLPPYLIPADSGDLVYPIEDTRFDWISGPSVNPFDLQPTDSLQVTYDPETGQYFVVDPMNPNNNQTLSFEEFWEQEDQRLVQDYWGEKSTEGSEASLGGTGGEKLFGEDGILQVQDSTKLMGFLNGADVDIRPSGGVELLMGFRKQKIENPTLPRRLQNQAAQPDFDMNINMSVLGKIGDNLNFNLNYNTKTTFDFENQVKLEYTGDEDDIIQKIEAGHIGFQLPTQLIPGSQSLFGIKTQLKFGRLTATSVLSQQKSSNECITIENGAQVEDFELYADEFEENRHFFLGQYFKNNYNKALETIPYINSDVIITYVEVWVSNRTGATSQTRNIVAMSDLGENDPYRQPQVKPTGSGEYPDNNANDLYTEITSKAGSRDLDQAVSTLQNNIGLDNVEDFRLIEARKLQPNEFTFDPQLGFVSLNTTLQSTDVLAVSYEYQNIWGERYQVGEFARDITPNFEDNGREEVLFVKMLKTIDQRPNIPLWDLMMRNVYSLGAYNIEDKGFRLNVFYDTPGGGATRFLPEGSDEIREQILIRLLGFDNLDYQKRQIDGGDGVFDFFDANDLNYQNANQIPSQQNNLNQGGRGGRGGRGNQTGINGNQTIRNINNARYFSTINKRNGRIYFPVIKPFGDDLTKKFPAEDAAIANKYAYDLLYDTTRIIARQFPEKNRFSIRGRYTSSTSSEFSLGAFNVPEGSIVVTAGGKRLIEGTDYTVNYSLGRVSLLNDAYLSSGIPIRICYEDPALFSLQQKNYFGTRLDYWINNDFTLGATYVHLSQRPFTRKVNYGDDAISNRMVGLDMNYYKDAPGLTRFVDKIPGLNTKEKSSVTFVAEAARFIPGHAKSIDLKSGGVVFLDDFEGTQSQISMEFPLSDWQLASTPQNGVFDCASCQNDLRYGYDRARFAWYQMDLPALDNSSEDTGPRTHYNRDIQINEIFPQRQVANQGISRLRTLDLSFNPTEKGPYNFNIDDLRPDGSLTDPKSRWGGMMRELDLNDFQFHNIEFIEFWMLDPFLEDPSNEGELYLNLGTMSEDILKDGRRSFENGLPVPGQPENTDTTTWARVSKNNVISRYFDSDTLNRRAQDVGLDGLDNDGERLIFQEYLDEIATLPNLLPETIDQINADPANDDFRFYLNAGWPAGTDPVERYRYFNNPQGNSVTVDNNNDNLFITSSTNLPDNEDLNEDNALEVAESFFEYKIDIKPDMQVGENFITNIRIDNGVNATIPDPVTGLDVPAKWYKFQIPVREFESAVGGINGFTAIQFMRLYMTNFEKPVVCRLTEFNLVRNNWRKYDPLIYEEGEIQPNDNAFLSQFNVNSVSFEQNYEKEPVPYRLPDGTAQEELFNNSSVPLRQNEQSLSLEVCDLEDGTGNAVFKTERYDMRQFKKLKMFIHAEEPLDSPGSLADGDVSAIIRLGSDFTQNYYEYEVPLKVTQPGGFSATETKVDAFRIWPTDNEINLSLDDLVELKKIRNFTLDRPNYTKPYSRFEEFSVIDSTSGEARKLRRKLTIVGSPDLGKVTTIMLAVRNPKRTERTLDIDDGLPKCAEVWFNELALAEFNEEGGYAALARADLKLADFGNVTLAGNMHTAGFGTLEQKVIERSQDNLYQFDATGNFNMDKFLPKESGVKIPLYVGYSESVSNPKYDPYNTDVILKEALDSTELYKGREARDSVKRQAQTFTSIESVNITNMRKVRTKKEGKPMPWDVSNFNASASYTKTKYRDPYIEAEEEKRYRAEVGYAYNARPKYIKPFNKLIKAQNKYLKLIRDFNFNFVPSSITFRTDVDRLLIQTKLRNLVGDKFEIPTIYNRDFLWGRHYGLKYDISKALSLDFTASNTSRIQELPGAPSQESKDLLKESFWNGGKAMEYNQTANIKYNVPIEKLPFLDWTKLRTTYGTDYRWLQGPVVLADSLDNGNRISNGQNFQINGELNFTKLYSKSKYLRNLSKPGFTSSDRSKDKKDPKKGKGEEAVVDGEEAKPKKKKKGQPGFLGKAFVSPLIMLKRASITYNERNATELPGFTPQSKILGQDWGNPSGTAPGLDFLFGMQPDSLWLNEAAGKGWITTNKQLNQQIRQTVSRDFRGKATLEPWNGLKIDLNWTYNYSELYTELYKVNRMGDFQHLGPNKIGSYSITYLPIRTTFEKPDTATSLSATYVQYEENRTIISNRLAEDNLPATGTFYSPKDSVFLNDFARGYGPYAQDVALNSFLAAYTGRDANTMKLNNIFRSIPLPNWSISYNGLSKIKAFQTLFSSFNLTHRYNSTLNVNNFSSEQRYDGKVYDLNPDLVAPYIIDTLSGNFFPLLRIPDIQISEQFAPLIGLDMTFTNNFTTRFEYRKTRSLGLSMGVDFQLNESNNEEFVVGLGYQTSGVKLPFFKNKDGETIILENDLTFQFDFSISDNITAVYGADQEFSQPVTGSRTIRLSPTIDYVVNERIRLTLYYDRTRTIPYTTQSYPTTNTKGGIRVNFSLAQ